MPKSTAMTPEANHVKAPLVTKTPLSDPAIRGLRWPYNLIALVNGDWPECAAPIDFHVSEQHEQFIVQTVKDFLTMRESNCILRYFRDHDRMTEIGRAEHVSRGRIDQNIDDAIRKLRRQPAVRDKIIYGPEAAQVQDMLQMQLAALRQQQRGQDLWAAELAKREELLQAQEYELNARLTVLKEHWASSGLKLPQALTGPAAIAPPPMTSSPLYSVHINELSFSTRAYNCMKKTGNTSLGKVVDLARTGKLMKIRNLGTGTAVEILTKVYQTTGEDLFSANKLDRPCDI